MQPTIPVPAIESKHFKASPFLSICCCILIAIYATYREWERQKKNINVKTGKPNMSTIAQKYGVKRQHVSKVVKDKMQDEKDIRHYIL